MAATFVNSLSVVLAEAFESPSGDSSLTSGVAVFYIDAEGDIWAIADHHITGL